MTNEDRPENPVRNRNQPAETSGKGETGIRRGSPALRLTAWIAAVVLLLFVFGWALSSILK